ncbi:hypothetical protein ACN2WE_04995 [Streptomyces sp. cg28]|uniref:hypothetical protein n=1 Tax=Streptomyces sp. cg28 TaxID=3403457 RepID=UPI003B2156D4
MPNRTPAQKLARKRKLQAETGKPYTACLTEAKKRLSEEPRQRGATEVTDA